MTPPRPVSYFLITFTTTWVLWFAAAAYDPDPLATAPGSILMVVGLAMPGVVGLVMVLTSGSTGLVARYRKSVLQLRPAAWGSLLLAVLLHLVVVIVSILVSCVFGQSLAQLSWAEGFSFADGGVTALVTLVLAAFLEEWGWRGYGEDSIANGRTWFSASVVFGLLWAFWHVPLLFIGGSYQSTLVTLGPAYAANFFLGILPLTFILTWVYVRSDRSMIACVLAHLFINSCQEKLALTPETKCIETIVMAVLAAAVVFFDRDLFFNRDHIGRLAKDDTMG